MTIELVTLPCLADNYAYLIRRNGKTAVVDAPEAAPILRALNDRGWRLDHIFITHHHADHIQGVPELVTETGAEVWGAAKDAHRLPPLDHPLQQTDSFTFAGDRVEVIDAPGHTLGHIVYHLPEAGLAFTGDSLMSWGCGRLFEGTPAQMFDTLSRLSRLPAATEICSGHEYTEANGRFALSLEPENPALLARMEKTRALRAQGEATVPVPLSVELATNPFLRSADPALRQALGLPDTSGPLDVFTEARARKDKF